MINKQVVLPKITVNKVWEWAGIGAPHPVLGTAAVWVADENEARFEKAVMESLEMQGLLSGGQVAGELTSTLRLVTNATEEYYAWVVNGAAGANGAILLAAREDKAVRIFHDGHIVVLEPIEPERVAEQFVDLLLRAEPADIEPFHLPKSRYSPDATVHDELDDSFEFEWQQDAPEQDPAVRLAELMRAERTAAQQVYTARRTPHGKRVRCGPYSVIDIANRGRIVTFLADSPSGEEHIRCLPGDKPTLVKELSAANAALA